MKKFSTEQVTENFRSVHQDKYDYSLVEYKNNSTKVKIICVTHGVFEQSPKSHKKGQGCPQCRYLKSSKSNSLTQKEFIQKSKKIHGDKYDYSLVDYKNSDGKVIIVCPVHGQFSQIANNHLRGHGCKYCSKEANIKRAHKVRGKHRRHFTQDNIMSYFNEVHNHKYDYSLVEYKGSDVSIKILCPIHGEFNQTPSNHIRGRGCPSCALECKGFSLRSSTEDFIYKAKKVHKNFYKYDRTIYVLDKSSVIITCPVHGDFNQKPSDHLQGKGCYLCGTQKIKDKFSLDIEEYKNRCVLKHKNKFNYNLDSYNSLQSIIQIECKIHGWFEQKALNHLTSDVSCPSCIASLTSIKEDNLYQWVLKYFPNAIQTYKSFWLGRKSLDIFIPNLNLAIEYNGIYWHRFDKENPRIYREYHQEKYNICKENDVNLIHIFEFEDLNKWKRKLKVYFENPEKYRISFKNNKRTVDNYILYGQSFIKI